MKILAFTLGLALASPALAGAPRGAPPIEISPGDSVPAFPACSTSVAKWHDLFVTSQVLIEGLLGADNPNVGILFGQVSPSGPWSIVLVKPDGSACPLIEGPSSRTLQGDGIALDDLQDPTRD